MLVSQMLTEVLPRMNELALEFADTSEKLFPELLEVKAGSHWIKLNSAVSIFYVDLKKYIC